MPDIAVALIHHPVLNRLGDPSTTAITSMDIHDFARTCAFYDVAPVYLVHPAAGMHAMVQDIITYWLTGEGGKRNPGRREVMKQIRMVNSLKDILQDVDYRLWYTSANPPEGRTRPCETLSSERGPHLIVFGTGWGLNVEEMPEPNGWLSPIVGIGKVRHLSVRAALAICLDRLFRDNSDRDNPDRNNQPAEQA